MLASSGTEETISYFIFLVQGQSLHTIPLRIMTDRDLAQINACIRRFPSAMILLCWWHVLRAWQQHLVTSCHTRLWELLKSWIRLTDAAQFDATWTEIQVLALPEFLKYLQDYWMPLKYLTMWSALHRRDRSIFEQSDTNMLLEAYVLKFSRSTTLLKPKTVGIMY